jgi:putative ATPase
MLFQPSHIPLPERLRPHSLDEYAGQRHLVGPGQVLRRVVEEGPLPSMILWGPPGVGKTTLARLIGEALERPIFHLSAISSGVKEVREVIARAEGQGDAILLSSS